jgi:hypothetical protein
VKQSSLSALVTRSPQRLLEQLFRKAKSQSLAYELSTPQAAPPDILSFPPPSPVVADVKHEHAASLHCRDTFLQVVACTLQPLLLAAAASTFTSQFCHVVANNLSSPSSLFPTPTSSFSSTAAGVTATLSDAGAAHAPHSFLMSASVRLLFAEHSATCAGARSKLCSAWAVAAAPLLLSQVHSAFDM